MEAWYNKYAVLALSAATGLFGYTLIDWSKLSSTEWAAWVQAVGSVAAIAVAIYIMSEQHRATRLRDRLVALERRESVNRAGVSAGYRTRHAFKGLARSLDAGQCDPKELRHQRSVFCQLLASIEKIPSWEAPGQVGHTIVELARMCNSAVVLIDASLLDPDPGVAELKDAVAKDLQESKNLRAYLVDLHLEQEKEILALRR